MNYHHVIEDSGYGDVGTHGYYRTIEEAQAEAKRLQGFFPQYTFWVYSSTSKRQPEFVTI